MFRALCAHHQGVKIALHSVWYHHTYRCDMCDGIGGCVMQFWPPDDEHMCSKHVQALNKTVQRWRCVITVKYFIASVNWLLVHPVYNEEICRFFFIWEPQIWHFDTVCSGVWLSVAYWYVCPLPTPPAMNPCRHLSAEICSECQMASQAIDFDPGAV